MTFEDFIKDLNKVASDDGFPGTYTDGKDTELFRPDYIAGTTPEDVWLEEKLASAETM